MPESDLDWAVIGPLASGGKRSYQLATRAANGLCTDPDTWVAAVPAHEGSWWQAWEGWLCEQSGKRVRAPMMGSKTLGQPEGACAPGRYVLDA